MLTVKLLGSPVIEIDGRPVDIPRRKSRALVYYLAARSGPALRDELLQLLWADLPRPAALQNLRTTLHGLKQILGEALELTGDRVGLSGDTEVDVARFNAWGNLPLQAASAAMGGEVTKISRSVIAPADATGEQATDGQAIDLIDALTGALAVYRGELLEGFSLPGEQAYEDWLLLERERLRRSAVRGWSALAAAHEDAGDFRAALEALEHALSFNPLQEDIQRECIRLMFLAGDRPGAILRYDALRRLLDEEMGVPPMAETRRLYDAILSDHPPEAVLRRPGRGERRADAPRRSAGQPVKPAVEAADRPGDSQPGLTPAAPDRAASEGLPGTATGAAANAGGSPAVSDRPIDSFPELVGVPLPFIGRRVERLRLAQALQPGRLVVIEGEPGIGKTRLAVEHLGTAGLRVAVGRAYELDQALPYLPVIDALRRLAQMLSRSGELAALRADIPAVWWAEAARLAPELEPAGDPEADRSPDEPRLWEGLRQVLAAASRLRPLALLFDDLHWADASTIGLLGYLARHSGDTGLRLLATARPPAARTPLTVLLHSLDREGRLTRLALERLDAGEVADAVQEAVKIPTGDPARLADWLYRASEGNPYILVELFRHARDSGWHMGGFESHPNVGAGLKSNVGAGLNPAPTEAVVPQNIYSLVQSRLDRLPDAARRLLDAGVAEGRQFDFDVAARAAGLSEAAALDALDDLLASGLVQPAGDCFTFDHSLTMEVAFREVGELRHRLLHRRVAEAIESLHPERLDEVAGLLAGHFAEGGDPKRAAHYALQAGDRAGRLAAWSEAIHFYQLALDGLAPAAQLPALLGLADAHTKAGHFAQSGDVLRRTLAWIDEHPQPAEVSTSIRVTLARNLLAQARFNEAVELAEELCRGGRLEDVGADLRACPERPEDVIIAQMIWGTALSLEGADLEGAARHLEAAEALLEKHFPVAPDLTLRAQIRFERGSVAAQQGRLPEAVARYRQSLDDAVAAVAPAQQPGASGDRLDSAIYQRLLALNNLAYHLHLLDDPQAVDYAEEGLKLANARGVMAMQTYLHSTRGEIALAAGDLETAEAHFQTGLELAERFNLPERVAGITANLGLLELRRERRDLALYRLSTARGLADSLGTQHLGIQVRLWLAPLLPEGEARALLEEARRMAQAGGRIGLLGQADEMLDILSH